MRSITSPLPNHPKKFTGNASPPVSPADGEQNTKPEWMKRLQEKNKQISASQHGERREYNRHAILFPSFDDCKTEITYLDDEDEIAESYFPEAKKTGSSDDTEDVISGYNFDELIRSS